MTEAYKNIEPGRLSLKDAETITSAKLLEETPSLSWESSDANRADGALSERVQSARRDYSLFRYRSRDSLLGELWGIARSGGES